jgi:hypothetical protein
LKNSWRNFLLLIIFIILSASPTTVFADEPPIPRDYMQEVGEKYIFVMLSPYEQSSWAADIHDESIRSTYSKSGLYVKGESPILLWTVDWYASQAEISSDGRYLIRWEFVLSYAEPDIIAFTLFENGRQIKEYAINELVTFPSLLPALFMWKENSSLDNEQNLLWIRTSNGEEYTIDLATGEIVKGITPKTRSTFLTFGMGFLILIVYFATRRVFRPVKTQKEI